jgi:hypothetical protein
MKIKMLAVALVFLLLVSISLQVVSAGTGEDGVKVKDKDGKDISKDNIIKSDTKDKDKEENKTANTGFESIEDGDFIRNEIAAGNEQFLTGLVSDIYSEFKESSVKDENGNTAGMIYTAVTFVPNPYNDNTIVELYGGYLNLSIFLTVMFILGESVSRSAARMKITYSSKYRLPQRKLIGGLAMCAFAMLGNIFYMLTLGIIEALNGFITMPVVPAMTPNPDHLVTFFMMGICDLSVMIFFIVRYFMIYMFAVICSVIFVMLVFKISRDFSQDIIEKMIRILALQPASLFVTSICILGMDSLPMALQPFGYVGTTVMIFLTCYWFMFGNFTLIKTGINIAVSKGLVKAGVRYK